MWLCGPVCWPVLIVLMNLHRKRVSDWLTQLPVGLPSVFTECMIDLSFLVPCLGATRWIKAMREVVNRGAKEWRHYWIHELRESVNVEWPRIVVREGVIGWLTDWLNHSLDHSIDNSLMPATTREWTANLHTININNLTKISHWVLYACEESLTFTFISMGFFKLKQELWQTKGSKRSSCRRHM